MLWRDVRAGKRFKDFVFDSDFLYREVRTGKSWIVEQFYRSLISFDDSVARSASRKNGLDWQCWRDSTDHSKDIPHDRPRKGRRIEPGKLRGRPPIWRMSFFYFVNKVYWEEIGPIKNWGAVFDFVLPETLISELVSVPSSLMSWSIFLNKAYSEEIGRVKSWGAVFDFVLPETLLSIDPTSIWADLSSQQSFVWVVLCSSRVLQWAVQFFQIRFIEKRQVVWKTEEQYLISYYQKPCSLLIRPPFELISVSSSFFSCSFLCFVRDPNWFVWVVLCSSRVL